MSIPILVTKLYIPPPRPYAVRRPRLIERLNESLHRKLTLISAPAGFGKTTLLSEWVANCDRRAAWLSLDVGDNDPARFLTYLVATLRTIAAHIGEGVLRALQLPQPPPIEVLLTTLLNEITHISENFVLILDDYHMIDTGSADKALTFLLEHMPSEMHLVIATREDPQIPLARLRTRSQMTELRVADLRFTPDEAAVFLNQVMGLNLSTPDIVTLETRTEGWIAGLQLAAMSLQGHHAPTTFIESFSGSHHFVLDYLIEEVLQQQPESIQNFLLRTSILDRLCGSLCDAIVLSPSISGQATLEYLERANLFVVPLDNERRWYRYHHLFADLLRQRLRQSVPSALADERDEIDELHIRASVWYEDNALEIEAFHHATAAQDLERAERLIEGRGIPFHLRGAVTTILDWLASLPRTVLNARPSLWWSYASLLLVNGQTTGVDEKLDAAEAALQGIEADAKTRNLIGQIAAARATLALTRYQVEVLIVQSHRALEYLPPENLPYRATANWTLGFACLFQGDRAAARHAFTEAISLSHVAGDVFTMILATIGLGQVQEAENQLYLAAETFRQVLQLAGDQPLQIISEAHLGLARVLYEWNELDAAEKHGQQSLQLARQYDKVIDRYVISEIFLARVRLAQGDVTGAGAMLAQAGQDARQNNFVYRIPEIAAVQVLTLLHQADAEAAAQLAQTYELPISQARVYIVQGDASAALAVLEPLRQQADEKGWEDVRLRMMVLQALALQARGEKDNAVNLLGDALALAAPNGLIRLFVDEGLPMAQLLSEADTRGLMPDYVGNLLAVFEVEKQQRVNTAYLASSGALSEPLSQRELEVLQLIAQGLSNREISERLFLALSTVKGHNQKIFDKLQVQRRTEALVRARELGLL
jgi:LuxR family transcriptional regulator, maltose regulon positive regulatory protein